MIQVHCLTSLRLPSTPFSLLSRRAVSSFAPAPPHDPAPIRHLLSITDLSRAELQGIVSRAREVKGIVKDGASGNPGHGTLLHKTVAMLFNKRSTRTRVSTESAVAHLSGSSMFLGANDVQLGVNESLYDTTRVLSGMVSCLVVRGGAHSDVEEMSRYAHVPVLNALTDTFHPLQAIADILTIQETVPAAALSESGTSAITSSGDQTTGVGGRQKVKVAWVGDANNVLNDLMLACTKLGYNFAASTPHASPIADEILEQARSYADEDGATVFTTTDPLEAVRDADVIVTDTWISMGQEAEREAKLKAFRGYQVTMDMARKGGAKEGWKFMHCLPRHAEEVSDEVFYSPNSVVFQEAENRKWAMIAALEFFCTQKGL